MKSATNYGKYIDKYGATGISYEDLGYKLSSDFNDKKPITREVALSMQTDLFKEMKDGGKSLLMKGGNDYTLPYADLITDVWTYAKLYNIEDYSIPFYEIALHGLKEYTGSSLNISDDYQKSLLYCVETGAGLNYTVMKAEVSELKDSTYTGYYGANYDAWKNNIVTDVKKIESDLGSTADQFIVGHKILSEGVTQTEYENGVKVIVNYSFLDYDSDGIKVGARDYIVIGGGK